MRTVGAMLREYREAKKLTIDQVEQDTKIRRKFLEAIEADNYSFMPSLAYAKGFVKNYSEYLGLPSAHIIAFFRRQTKEAPKSSLLPHTEPLNTALLQLTPARFITFVISTLVLLFLTYFLIQYRKLQQPPVLALDSPPNQTVISKKQIDVMGKTDPDATVTINGVSTIVRNDGRFYDRVTLEAGINTITVVAVSRYGKTTTITKNIELSQ